MENTIKVNRSQLVKAFRTWMEDYVVRPDEFKSIEQAKLDPSGYGELCADHLMKILKENEG